jgi:hypothetical protein
VSSRAWPVKISLASRCFMSMTAAWVDEAQTTGSKSRRSKGFHLRLISTRVESLEVLRSAPRLNDQNPYPRRPRLTCPSRANSA